MTTQSRLHVDYVKSTERTDPHIRVFLSFPVLTLLKLLVFSLLGQMTPQWYTLSDQEVEHLSKVIVRWRLVKNLRTHKRHAIK